MRVLVTGAGGFIGSQVTRALVEAGHEVTASARPGSAARLDPVRARIRLEALDLEDTGAVEALLRAARAEAVFHLAWYVDPRDYLTSRGNLGALAMTTALAARAFDHGCRKLVAVGSCMEYADSERPRREDEPPDPVSLYAATKVSAHLVLGALARAAGAELAWGRVFQLYGPGEGPPRLLPWIAEQLRQNTPVELTDGRQIRDYLHVTDVAAGLVALLPPGAAGPYNICSGEPVTLRQVIETIGRALDREHLLRFGARPHRPGEVMFLAGDATRLRALGWRPRFSLEAGLRDAVGV